MREMSRRAQGKYGASKNVLEMYRRVLEHVQTRQKLGKGIYNRNQNNEVYIAYYICNRFCNFLDAHKKCQDTPKESEFTEHVYTRLKHSKHLIDTSINVLEMSALFYEFRDAPVNAPRECLDTPRPRNLRRV